MKIKTSSNNIHQVKPLGNLLIIISGFKAMFQTPLGSPHAVLWTSVSLSCGYPKSQLCRQTQCSAKSSSACRQEPSPPPPTWNMLLHNRHRPFFPGVGDFKSIQWQTTKSAIKYFLTTYMSQRNAMAISREVAQGQF